MGSLKRSDQKIFFGRKKYTKILALTREDEVKKDGMEKKDEKKKEKRKISSKIFERFRLTVRQAYIVIYELFTQ